MGGESNRKRWRFGLRRPADASRLTRVQWSRMHFGSVGEVSQVETIASGARIPKTQVLAKALRWAELAQTKGHCNGSPRQTARSDRPKCTGLKPTALGWKGLKIKRFLE